MKSPGSLITYGLAVVAAGSLVCSGCDRRPEVEVNGKIVDMFWAPNEYGNKFRVVIDGVVQGRDYPPQHERVSMSRLGFAGNYIEKKCKKGSTVSVNGVIGPVKNKEQLIKVYGSRFNWKKSLSYTYNLKCNGKKVF